MRKVNVLKDEEGKEIAVEIMSEAILSISQGIKKLRSSRLNDKALYLLIQHAAPTISYQKVGMFEIKAVIEGIESLEKTYLKKG